MPARGANLGWQHSWNQPIKVWKPKRYSGKHFVSVGTYLSSFDISVHINIAWDKLNEIIFNNAIRRQCKKHFYVH